MADDGHRAHHGAGYGANLLEVQRGVGSGRRSSPSQDLRLAAACWHEDEPVLALANDLLVAGGQHAIANQIAERYIHALKARYLSNGCHRCSALFGAFFIGETVLEVAASKPTLAAFRLLTTGPIDHARWTALVDARTSAMG